MRLIVLLGLQLLLLLACSPSMAGAGQEAVSPSRHEERVYKVDPDDTDTDTDTEHASCGAGQDGRGCVFGLFIGMHDDGVDPMLPHADDDAIHLEQAFRARGLMRDGDGVVLVDRQATYLRVLDTMNRLEARMTSDDVFVFFFDGHGSNRRLGLWREEMNYENLRSFLELTPAGQSVVILDACRAGSFAGLGRLSTRTQVVGFFSSRGDEESATAPDLDAGGYLAAFFVDSLYSLDEDGVVTIHDQRRYLARRYIDALGPDRDQHLVASNGSAVLWRIHPTD